MDNKDRLIRLIKEVQRKADDNHNEILIIGSDEDCTEISDMFGMKDGFIDPSSLTKGAGVKLHKIEFHCEGLNCNMTIMSMPHDNYGDVYVMANATTKNTASYTYDPKFVYKLNKEE